MGTPPVIMGGATGRRLERRGTVAARLAVVFSLALAAGASLPVAAATVTIDAERDGDTIIIHTSASLNADPATAWRVLTDYERYPEFIPDLRLSRVVARNGDTVTVEQSGGRGTLVLEERSPYHETGPGGQPRLMPLFRPSGGPRSARCRYFCDRAAHRRIGDPRGGPIVAGLRWSTCPPTT